MKEITVEAAVQNIEAVTDFVNAQLEAWGCPRKARLQIDIAVDELFSNIARYAYAPGSGMATVRVEITGEPPSAVVTFLDRGRPYDPLSREDPDTTLSAQDRQIGGLGIFMVKKSMDEVTYSYEDGQNMLSIRKKL